MLLMGTRYTANNTGDVLLQVFRLNSRFLCGSVPYLKNGLEGVGAGDYSYSEL